MNKFKNLTSAQILRTLFLVAFPVSVLFVRVLTLCGYDPGRLASLSPLTCPLKLFFGISCPTCGLTRAVLYAWIGDFEISLRYHFGGLVILILGIAFYFLLVFDLQGSAVRIFSRLKSKPEFKVFLLSVIFLYSFWGFFLRSNI